MVIMGISFYSQRRKFLRIMAISFSSSTEGAKCWIISYEQRRTVLMLHFFLLFWNRLRFFLLSTSAILLNIV